jgi:hypothetical protein
MNSRTRSRFSVATIAAVGLIAIAPGCIERTETIRVEPGGAAHLRVVFKGDPDDIRTGDAMLNEPGPWSVVDTWEPQDDGSQKLVRTATLTVPAGTKWPEQYCPENSDLAGLALAMPTSVRIEERPDGTYYHFTRIYRRRDWARVDYFRRTLVEPAAEPLQGKQKADVTPQQRENLARGLLQYEKAKALVLAQAASEALRPGLKQDEWLVLRQAIADVYDRIGIERVARILQMEDQQVGEEIQRLVDEVSGQVRQAIRQTLSASDATGSLGRRFAEQFEVERRRHSVSEDLQDENWTVSLELPGRLVGHNGDSVKGGVVTWKFAGNALCDRDQILMATSVVERQ